MCTLQLQLKSSRKNGDSEQWEILKIVENSVHSGNPRLMRLRFLAYNRKACRQLVRLARSKRTSNVALRTHTGSHGQGESVKVQDDLYNGEASCEDGKQAGSSSSRGSS
jgi:hypothetical protein